MKFLKKLFILGLVLIFTINISKVNALSNPYKESGPYGINCTWYTWKMAYEKAGIALPGWGNAKEWYDDAKADGYSVGTTPKANSIIVWGNWTSYGHVGYVEAVEGNILHVWDSTGPCIDEEDQDYQNCMANSVSEETDKICKNNAKRIACEYTISTSDYVVSGYIYLDYIPSKVTTPNNDNSKKENIEVTKSNNTNLRNITISNSIINFDKNILEYNVVLENEIDNITITALVEDEKSIVDGTGNYNLKIGLNEIKLKVTAEDKSTKEYIIKITRNEKISNELEESEQSKIQEKNIREDNNVNYQIATIFIIGCFIFLLLVSVIIIKHLSKKNN